MAGRVFLDTNVLVYLFDRDAPAKQHIARDLIAREEAAITLSAQVLEEFYVTVTRKLGRPLPEADAEAAVRDLALFDIVEIDAALVILAVATARRHRVSLWDALVIEAARVRGCERLLTEDLQHGRRFGAVEVSNPFISA